MQRHLIGSMLVALTVTALGSAGLAGQTSSSSQRAAAGAWTPPRAADGHPDISGVWMHNAATPMERPDELAGRPELTDDELKAMERMAAQLFDGSGDAAFGDTIYLATLRNVLGKVKGFTSTDTTGNYNSFWIIDRWFEKRTSLLTEPADGKFPPVTAAAEKRRADEVAFRKQYPYDGPENIALGQRCISGSVPMFGGGLVAGYNNYYQIVQTPTHVGINMEMRHDTRSIPITNRPHLPASVRLWLGDPVGRWEGDTLVVESTNFRDDAPLGYGGGSAQMHVTERFTRTGPDILRYEATVNDPATWTKPWTAVLNLKRTPEQIYEFACHEANEAMSGTLRGARVTERKASAAATRP